MLFFFSFNDTATTEIYTLSLHDALPICPVAEREEILLAEVDPGRAAGARWIFDAAGHTSDRKSTRLNSSHVEISYAVFCLKKKKKNKTPTNENIGVYSGSRYGIWRASVC